MAAELQLQTAHGGLPGTPHHVAPLVALRFKNADNELVDDSQPIIHPRLESFWTYEKWVRLWCFEGPPQKIKNFRFLQVSGPPMPAVRQWWGERGQDEGYVPPVAFQRYATYPVPMIATPVQNDNIEYFAGDRQIGPWLIFQWEVTPQVMPGPQGPVTYRIAIDEY